MIIYAQLHKSQAKSPPVLEACNMSSFIAHDLSGRNRYYGGGIYEAIRVFTGDTNNEI